MFDLDIFKAVKGYSKESPQDLPGILGFVDSRQRLVLTFDELAGGLARLVEAGQIAEAGNFRYYAPDSPPASRSFTGLPTDEYERACRSYREGFADALRELDSKPPSPADHTRQKIVIRWALPGNSYP